MALRGRSSQGFAASGWTARGQGCRVPARVLRRHPVRTNAQAGCGQQGQHQQLVELNAAALALPRRAALAALAAAPVLGAATRAQAVQGLTAGRIPGVSAEAADDGFRYYQRPEGKSGGHGVGWTEVPRYSFRVPPGWGETPVSIADLGGTEIDLRFADASRKEGSLMVVVAPIARFADIDFNADVRIDQLASPNRIISGFAPELFGTPLSDEDVLEQQEERRGDLTYYNWMVRPHRLVTATAAGNRLLILAVSAQSAHAWRKHQDTFRAVQRSFAVPAPNEA